MGAPVSLKPRDVIYYSRSNLCDRPYLACCPVGSFCCSGALSHRVSFATTTDVVVRRRRRLLLNWVGTTIELNAQRVNNSIIRYYCTVVSGVKGCCLTGKTCSSYGGGSYGGGDYGGGSYSSATVSVDSPRIVGSALLLGWICE